jgi:hypothetical protein
MLHGLCSPMDDPAFLLQHNCRLHSTYMLILQLELSGDQLTSACLHTVDEPEVLMVIIPDPSSCVLETRGCC